MGIPHLLGIKSIKKGCFVLHFRDFYTAKFEFSKGKNCREIRIYGKYCVLIRLLFLRNNRFDSDFNPIFDYVHGTHCLSTDALKNTVSFLKSVFLGF